MSPKKKKQGTDGLAAPLLEKNKPAECIADSITEQFERKRAESLWMILKNRNQNCKDLEAITFVMAELDRYKERIRSGHQYEVYYHLYLLDLQFSHMTGIAKNVHQWLCSEINGEVKYLPSKQEIAELFRFVMRLAKSEYPEKTRDGRTFKFSKVCKLVTDCRDEWEEKWGPIPEEGEFARDKFRLHLEHAIKPLHKEAKQKKSPLDFFIRKLYWWDHEGVLRCDDEWDVWAKIVEEDTPRVLHWAAVGVVIHHLKGQGQLHTDGLQDPDLSTFVERISTVTLPSFLWNLSLYKGLLVSQAQQAQNLTTKVTAGLMTAGIAGGQFLANAAFHHYMAEGDGQ